MKIWHQMTGLEAMRARADYASYNYGRDSAITIACRQGTEADFMIATKQVTENSDAVLAGIQNKIIAANLRTREEQQNQRVLEEALYTNMERDS
jgi:uncharacterized membrane protein